MSSVPFFKLCFTPKWIYTLLTLVFCAVFCVLGLWQLSRAEEKKQMLYEHELQSGARAVSLSRANTNLLQYQEVSLSGHFLQQNLLLDNQHHQHQIGYDVLTPMELDDGSVVVVDRGWVRAGESRVTFPTFKNTSALVKLEGTVYYPSKNQWTLGESIENRDGGIVLVENIDIKLLSQLLQKPLYPFIIRLNSRSSQGFVREWSVVAMAPERHLAYAAQWFAFSLVTLILFVALNIKKIND